MLPWLICGGLAAAVMVLLVKLWLLRRSLDEMMDQLGERLGQDTNSPIFLSTQDAHARKLASELNLQLKVLRRQRQQFQQGDTELKNAVTNISHDQELCKQAQEIALNELAGSYNSIYANLTELLDVKVEEGKSISTKLSLAGWILAFAVVAVIALAVVFATKIGKSISKKISSPLGKLGKRLKTFASGDLSSPFPMIETGDEVEYMEKDATEMADNLNVIIKDIGEVLGDMAEGNYSTKSRVAERYTGDLDRKSVV